MNRRSPKAPVDRRRRPIASVGVVLVFLFGFGATTAGFAVVQHRARVVFAKQQESLRQQQKILYEAQFGSCLRVNRLRFNDNRNAVTEYDTLQIIAELTKGPSPSQAMEIRRVLDRLSRTSPETTRAIVELMRPVPGLDSRFRRLARTIKWIPATDCRSAVPTPEQFRAPIPRPVYRLSRRDRHELRVTGHIP